MSSSEGKDTTKPAPTEEEDPKKKAATEPPDSVDEAGSKKTSPGAPDTEKKKAVSLTKESDSADASSKKTSPIAAAAAAAADTEEQEESNKNPSADEKSLEDGGGGDDDEEASSPSPSKPKFHVFQKVYARDKDGVMYAAVVRRQLFGPQYNKQIMMGLMQSKKEADEILTEQDNANNPVWHYFVHFNNWAVSFDRWVSEDDVFEISDEVKAYAERLSQEHKALQKALRKPASKHRKSYQTVDGRVFLREWRKRMVRIDKEMNFGNASSRGSGGGELDASGSEDELAAASSKEPVVVHPPESETQKPKAKKKSAWTKASLAIERKLREKGLTTKRPQGTRGATIILPFALKKALVEQWEIISQCHMMPAIPANVTIRQALDKYLESKNVAPRKPTTSDEKTTATVDDEKKEEAKAPPKTASDETTEDEKKEETKMLPMKDVEAKDTDEKKQETKPQAKPFPDETTADDNKEVAKVEPAKDVKSKDSDSKPQSKASVTSPEDGTKQETKTEPMVVDAAESSNKEADDKPKEKNTTSAACTSSSTSTPSKSVGDAGAGEASAVDRGATKDDGSAEAEEREQEWRDMADGIAMLFDEALPSRLLYKEELPQLRVIDSVPEFSMTPFSELYGCEHLLRMFVRLPDMLAGDELSDAEVRPIIAKVNDFVRFLQRNQGSLLTQAHRKLNDLELKEQQKMQKAAERKRKAALENAENDANKKPRQEVEPPAS